MFVSPVVSTGDGYPHRTSDTIATQEVATATERQCEINADARFKGLLGAGNHTRLLIRNMNSFIETSCAVNQNLALTGADRLYRFQVALD